MNGAATEAALLAAWSSPKMAVVRRGWPAVRDRAGGLVAFLVREG